MPSRKEGAQTFSPAAQIAMGWSQCEAINYQAPLRPEHMLLGMMESPIIEQGLERSGVIFNRKAIVLSMRALLGRRPDAVSSDATQKMIVSSEAAGTFHVALGHARSSGVKQVGLVDLLVSLTDEPNIPPNLATTLLAAGPGLTKERLIQAGAVAAIRKVERRAVRGELIAYEPVVTIPTLDAEHEIPRFDALLRQFGPDFMAYHLGRTTAAVPFHMHRFDEPIQEKYLGTLRILEQLVAEVQRTPVLSRRFAQGVWHELRARNSN